MLNNNINPMMNNMNNINPNMMINPMMNNMNQNMMINPMMNNMNQNMMINPMMNNMNQNMIMNPMMNNMNQMVGNINNLNQQMNKEIKVIVKAENKFDIVSCFENDDIITFEKKLKELNFTKLYLIHNYQVLDPKLTLKDNGIVNGAIIYIKSKIINVTFITTQGYKKDISLDEDCPVHMAIIIFGFLSQENFVKKINDKKLVFIFNAYQLRINDETPIKIFFNNTINPRVVINDVDSLIGG